MSSIPLPAVEFAAFMAFAVWLFFWQRKTSQRGRDRNEPRLPADDKPQG